MVMSNEPLLLHEESGGVVRLTLNRPQAFNSLNRALLDALHDALDTVAASPSARVVVLAGQGRAFCAGHDLKEIGADRRAEAIHALFAHCSAMMLKLQDLPQPVIAEVDGIATAAGCQLAAACDLAICTEESRFATSGVKYGLFCSTPMVALSRAVPQKPAMEMLLTGDFIDAAEAHRLGLVNRVVAKADLAAATDALCARLLDKPRDVLAAGKRAFYRQRTMTAAEAYDFTTGVIVKNAIGDAFGEGLAAFVEKRRPVWPG
jgi:enoyl-CoA hydratase/carnithine racemase